MTHMLLCHGGILASQSMSIVQHLSSYWSAAVHDYEHGGLNNDFLCKTAHPLSLLYNDISPLENHHISAAASLLMQPEYGYIEVCFWFNGLTLEGAHGAELANLQACTLT